MTDRLSTLLHAEVDQLAVPVAPAARVIADGRSIRRRRTTGVAAGALAAVLAVVGIAVINQRWSDDDAITPAEQKAYVEKGAWAVGDELHVGDHVVTVPGLDTFRYTSLGVLAWSVHYDDSDPSAASTSVLVRPDGTTTTIEPPGLAALVRPPATDPTSPDLAYLRAVGSLRGQVMVTDLGTGETRELGEPLYLGSRPTSAPLSLTPDAALINKTWSIDRSSGAVTKLHEDGLTVLSGYAHDRRLSVTGMDAHSYQVLSGNDVLLDVPDTSKLSSGQSPIFLSPDGRFVTMATGENGVDVYTVATGEKVHLGGDWDVSDLGWTPDGHLVGKRYPHNASEVEICDPETGACAGTGVTVADQLLLVTGADALPLQ